MKKRVLVLYLLVFLLSFSLHAMSAETIYHASSSILRLMAESRSLSTEGSDDDIRRRLWAYYGYDEVTVTADADIDDDTDESAYTLTIRNAGSVTSQDGVVTLEGNVAIDFDFSDDERKSLLASTVIVDSEKAVLTAIGDAIYTDSDTDAAIGEISADILTVKWEKMDILLTGGSTSTERENSAKKKVTFSTSGERLTYLSEGAVVFSEGYITSNPDTAYSSISADSIMILPGQDMFLSSASFNIGRVPIFYLPFFFFPGSRILGNPSFGFSSEKGAFVNTTFELIGSYPGIESTDESSSFSSLLKSTSRGEEESVNGYYYSTSEEKSEIESFAEKTSSYLVLMADAYKGGESATLLKGGGMHASLSGLFNLFDKKLRLSFSLGAATPLTKGSKKTRYYGNTSLSFSRWGLNAELKFPFYSDSSVLYHYGNRLTGFSYGPLLGGKSTFSSTYSSSGITSFSRSFTLSYTLPSSVKIPFVSSFSLKNLSIDGSFSLPSSSEKAILSSYSLPLLSVSVSGTILQLTTKDKERKNEDNTSQSVEEKNAPLEEEEEEKDILLMDMYETQSALSSSSSLSSYKESSFILSYTLSEDFSRRITNSSSDKTAKDGKLSSTFYSRLNAEGRISDWITFTNVFTSSLGYTESEDFVLSSWTRKTSASPLDTFKVTVPSFGLVYTLSFKPFEFSKEEKSSGERTDTSSLMEFTSSYIKTHSLSLSKSFTLGKGNLTGSLSYILPPLEGSITPSLKWNGGAFSTSLSWLIRESGEGYRSDKLTLSFLFSSSFVTLSSNFYYQTHDFDALEFWKPFTMSSTLRLGSGDARYYAEGKLNADGAKENFVTGVTATLKLDEITGVFTFKNSADRIEFDSLNIRTDLSTKSFQLWKGRIYCAFALDSTLFLSHTDRTRSYISLSPSFTLSCAEFVDITVSVKSRNSKLGSYYEGDTFSFSSMWDDLLRSVDFFGKGRYNTSFVLQSVSVECVHYMEDWNLNFSYTTSFQRSTLGGKTIYTLQPSFSVYLAWNTMPDLKVDEKWTKDSDGNWTRK